MRAELEQYIDSHDILTENILPTPIISEDASYIYYEIDFSIVPTVGKFSKSSSA